MIRSNPHLIEINARVFLNEMRQKYSMPDMSISMIPDEEWLKFKHLGFDIVWLMGVWKTSEISKSISMDEDFLRDFISKMNMDISAISASPYSVLEYRLDDFFGFEWELKALKEKLNSFGMKLFLDFVSNHMAIDSNFANDCVDCLVCGDESDYEKNKELFCSRKIGNKIYYIAHGKDPNFPPWKDTVQLNYFNPVTRQKMIEELKKISEMCDGVRCDMVMLSLNDVFESVWGWLVYKKGYSKPDKEFWQDAISEIKSVNPSFTFIAEVYWGLEWRLQQLGFDYTYDKVFYDRLKKLSADDVRGHLMAEKLYQKKSVRFIDNHDEEPSITSFGDKRRALAASVMISTVRGLRFYHYFQLKGIPIKIPVQIAFFDIEKYKDIEIEKFYIKLLKIVDHPAFHGGEWELCDVNSLTPNDKTNKNIIAYKWSQMRTIKIVVINYSPEVSSGYISISFKAKSNTVMLYEELSERFFSYKAEEVSERFKIEKMQPYSFYIFDYEF